MNFDKSLLSMMEEARLWGRLRHDVPAAVIEISAKREQYRLQREQVQSHRSHLSHRSPGVSLGPAPACKR